MFWWKGCLSNEAAEDVVLNNAIYEREVGSELPVTLLTLAAAVAGCRLDTPAGVTVQFKPEDTSSDKYLLRADTALSQCSVTILDIEQSDAGSHRLHAEDADGATIAEAIFTISVPSADADESAGKWSSVSKH